MSTTQGEKAAHHDTPTTTRRHHYRVDCELTVGFEILGTGSTGRAHLVNIGLGGARLDLPEPVSLPQEIRIHIRPRDASAEARNIPPLTLKGRVVWTVEHGAGAPYPCGIRFVDPGRDVALQLRRFIGALLEGTPDTVSDTVSALPAAPPYVEVC